MAFSTDIVQKANVDLSNLSDEGLSKISGGIFNVSGYDIGDIGISALGINESLNKRRYLNGQVISQKDFPDFTKRLKSAIVNFPSLATTESDWQNIVTNSKLGQCGKFVVNNTAGTIRLPKVVNLQGLTDLTKFGNVKEESLPNITGEANLGEKGGSVWALRTTNTQGALTARNTLTSGNYASLGSKTDVESDFSGLKLNASNSSSTYQDDAPVQEEAIQYPYFIQVARDFESSGEIPGGSASFPLFYFQFTDHLLENSSWLRADTFSWQDGAVYKSAYEELEKEYNNEDSTTETEGTVTFKRTPKGYKIADASQQDVIINLYEQQSIAWYYIIDTTNKKFKLPRTKYNFVGVREGVGNLVPESLPNITGSLSLSATYGDINGYGVFTGAKATGMTGSPNSVSKAGDLSIPFNANKSSLIYQDNAPVQQKSTEAYLYFFIGNTIQNATEVDVGKVMEMVNDYSLSDLDASIEEKTNEAQETVDTLFDSIDAKLEDLKAAAAGKIGDTVFTLRKGNAPFGCVWCDGQTYSASDYPDIWELLTTDQLESISMDTYESVVNLHGSCGIIGLNSALKQFRVPLLDGVYVKSSNNTVLDTFGEESLPNITGDANTISNNGDVAQSGCFIYAAGVGTSEKARIDTVGSSTGNIAKFSFNASGSSSTYQDNAKVNPDHVSLRAYIILYAARDVDSNQVIQLNNPFSLFDFKRSDHLLNNLSWLRADTFSWHDGNVYHSAYDELENEYNTVIANGWQSVMKQETIDGVLILYFQTPKGYKIVYYDTNDTTTHANYAKLQTLFEQTGVAWYYVLDKNAKRFKLPRTKYGFTGLRNNAGDYVPESLPDLVALCGYNGVGGQYRQKTSQYTYTADSYQNNTSGSSTASTTYGSEVVTKGNNPVQERSTETYLYFYVGETLQNGNFIDLEKNTNDIAQLQQDTLKTNQITNCITEIPQDIKLELNDGVLTLKAGSKVYVPDGFEDDGTTPKFDVRTIATDMTLNADVTEKDLMIFTAAKNEVFAWRIPSACQSGTIDPAEGSGINYYNTNTNILTAYNTTTGSGRISFPLAIISVTSGVVNEIKQVFNGFGYIGKLNYILPKVKFLISKGYNSDGSYKNKEYVMDRVLVSNNDLGASSIMFFRNNNNNTYQIYNIYKQRYLGELSSVPSVGSSFEWYYNTTNRLWYMHEVGETSWRQIDYINVGYNSATGTEFNKAFQAVDRSDTSFIAHQAMPSDGYIDLTVGSSGSTYTAPADGYFSMKVTNLTSDKFMLLNIRKTDGTYLYALRLLSNSVTNDVEGIIPCKKGNILQVIYDGSNTTQYFRFIYAEGSL